MRKNPMALIAADDPELVERAAKAIKSKSIDIITTIEAKTGIKEFIDKQPEVVLLSFNQVVDAEKLLFQMVKQAMSGKPFRYYTVMLCRAKDAKLAFDLCIKNVFDDYVIDKPLYDIHKLQLIVYRAIERLKANNRAGEINDSTSVLNHFREAIEQGMRSGANAKNLLLQLRENVSGYVDKVSADFMSSRYEGILRVMDKQQLIKNLNEFKQENFDKEFDRVENGINTAMNEMITTLKTKNDNIKTSKNGKSPSANRDWQTVLTVEDDQLYQDIITRTLENEKYVVYRCSTGIEVLGVLNSQQFIDLVLMDHELPQMNGAEVVKWIRAFPQMKDVPIIMLTGFSDKKTLQECVAAGATDFIKKPANRKIILDKVHQYLGGVTSEQKGIV